MQRRHSWMSMSVAIVLCFGASVVEGQHPWQRNVQPQDKPLNALMRWVGFGYSDGYHAEYSRRAPASTGGAHWGMWSSGPAVQSGAGSEVTHEHVLPSPLVIESYSPTPAPHQPAPSIAPPPSPQPTPAPLELPQIEIPDTSPQPSPSDLNPPASEALPAPPKLPRLPLHESPPVIDPDAPAADPMQTRRRPYWWTR